MRLEILQILLDVTTNEPAAAAAAFGSAHERTGGTVSARGCAAPVERRALGSGIRGALRWGNGGGAAVRHECL